MRTEVQDKAVRMLLGGNPFESVPGSHNSTVHQWNTSQSSLYSQRMLTIASRVDVMNRLGRAMADPTRSRILTSLIEGPGYPGQLAAQLGLTRSNVSNHLSCLRGCGIVAAVPEGRQTRYEIADPHLSRALLALVDVVLAVDDGDGCVGADCDVPLCCPSGAQA